jgi:hypothetical protein
MLSQTHLWVSVEQLRTIAPVQEVRTLLSIVTTYSSVALMAAPDLDATALLNAVLDVDTEGLGSSPLDQILSNSFAQVE